MLYKNCRHSLVDQWPFLICQTKPVFFLLAAAAANFLFSLVMPKHPRATLCLDDYDCVGFDLDHTLCRYNIGPMIRLEYDLLAEFLVSKKGYDATIRAKIFDDDREFVCKGLTLDCEKGNLLRLGYDGFILGKLTIQH